MPTLTVIAGARAAPSRRPPRPAKGGLPAAGLARWRRQALAAIAGAGSTPTQRVLAFRFLRQHGVAS